MPPALAAPRTPLLILCLLMPSACACPQAVVRGPCIYSAKSLLGPDPCLMLGSMWQLLGAVDSRCQARYEHVSRLSCLPLTLGPCWQQLPQVHAMLSLAFQSFQCCWETPSLLPLGFLRCSGLPGPFSGCLQVPSIDFQITPCLRKAGPVPIPRADRHPGKGCSQPALWSLIHACP